jgi:hypothetical protein
MLQLLDNQAALGRRRAEGAAAQQRLESLPGSLLHADAARRSRSGSGSSPSSPGAAQASPVAALSATLCAVAGHQAGRASTSTGGASSSSGGSGGGRPSVKAVIDQAVALSTQAVELRAMEAAERLARQEVHRQLSSLSQQEQEDQQEQPAAAGTPAASSGGRRLQQQMTQRRTELTQRLAAHTERIQQLQLLLQRAEELRMDPAADWEVLASPSASGSGRGSGRDSGSGSSGGSARASNSGSTVPRGVVDTLVAQAQLLGPRGVHQLLWSSLATASDYRCVGLRLPCCCPGAAVLLPCCCGSGLRWSKWSSWQGWPKCKHRGAGLLTRQPIRCCMAGIRVPTSLLAACRRVLAADLQSRCSGQGEELSLQAGLLAAAKAELAALQTEHQAILAELGQAQVPPAAAAGKGGAVGM